MERKYLGKLCFLERIKENGTPDYYTGEYLVLKQTASCLYGIKIKGGCDSHTQHAFPLVGKEKWNVISTDDAKNLALELADDLLAFSKEINRPKKRWVDSVYLDCKRNAEIIKSIYKDASYCKTCGQYIPDSAINAEEEVEIDGKSYSVSTVKNALKAYVD